MLNRIKQFTAFSVFRSIGLLAEGVICFALGASGCVNLTVKNMVVGDTAADRTAESVTITSDTLAPSITGISLPSSRIYALGEHLDFSISFDENVQTTGSRLLLTIGPRARSASYLSGNGTQTIVYRYTVSGSDFDTDGIGLAASIDLNGGTLSDTAGNSPASLVHGAGSTAGIQVETLSYPHGATSIDFDVNLDESGEIYYAIYNTDPGIMSASAVRSAAIGALGGTLVVNGTIHLPTADTTVRESITGLDDATTYYIRMVPEGDSFGLHPDAAVRSLSPIFPDRLSRTDLTSVTFKAGQEIRYAVFKPEAYYKESSNTYPVIISLHGWGEVVTTLAADSDANFNTFMRTAGLTKEIENGNLDDLPFIVLQTRCPSYDAVNCWGWAGATALIDETFEHAKTQLRIDPTRVYVMGLSSGGGGAVNYAKAYPAKVAAVAAISMVSAAVNCGSLANIPFWFFHNSGDTSQSSTNSVTARDALVACPSVVAPKLTRFTDCPTGVCHDSWTRVFTLSGGPIEIGDTAFDSVYDWFLNYTK